MSKSDETLLVVFERKMLRRILGPVCVKGQWRSRYNDELYKMYGDLTVVQRIKLARLRWAGHVVRPQGQRRCGKPQWRWPDSVEASVIKAGITLLRQAKTVKAVVVPDKQA